MLCGRLAAKVACAACRVCASDGRGTGRICMFVCMDGMDEKTLSEKMLLLKMDGGSPLPRMGRAYTMPRA